MNKKLIAVNDTYLYRILRDNRYQVKNDGTLWSRISVNGAGLIPDGSWRQVGSSDSHGYSVFRPRFNGKKVKIAIHRIVYAAFNGKLDDRMVIDHINKKRHDNRPCNLRLVTWSENKR